MQCSLVEIRSSAAAGCSERQSKVSPLRIYKQWLLPKQVGCREINVVTGSELHRIIFGCSL